MLFKGILESLFRRRGKTVVVFMDRLSKALLVEQFSTSAKKNGLVVGGSGIKSSPCSKNIDIMESTRGQ